MKTQCPHCQAYFNIKPEYVGKRTKCKNCGQGFLIAEASAKAAVTPLSFPAKITRAAASAPVDPRHSSGGLSLRNAAEEATKSPAPQTQAAAAEITAIPEVKITIEEAATDQKLEAGTKEPEMKPVIEAENETKAASEPQAPAEEAPEIPAVQAAAELAQQASTGASEPPKPSAAPAQIHEALKSSKTPAPAHPLPVAAAVPAFQPVAAAQPTAYGQPGAEWGAVPAPGAAHPGSGLGSFPLSDYPASATFQPLGLAGAGTGYGSASQYPAGASAYPVVAPPQLSSPAAVWGDQSEAAAQVSMGAMASPGAANGQTPSPNWPRNGGGQVPPPGRPELSGRTAAYGRPAPATPAPTTSDWAEEEPAGLVKRLIKRVPLAVWIAAALAFILGGLAGGKINALGGQAEIQGLQAAVSQARQEAQVQKNAQVESLRKERQRLQEDLLRVASYSLDYPEGSIPRALAQAASEEFKIADTLLLQQIAAVESGAKVTVSVKQTRPDPELAATLETEMIKLEEEIARQWQEAKGLDETPKMLATTSIATQLVSLAILNRNLLIARYGLSSPVPLQYHSPAPEPAAAPAPPVGTDSADAGQALAEIERLKQENEKLRAESEMLLNSDSALYASAVSDLGTGQLTSAEDKFKRLLRMFPASPLIPRATEGLAEIRVRAAEKEAAKNPPLEIMATGVKHDGGYFRNQTYVRVSFKNISPLMIKRVEFKVLTFDDHGYPIASKRLDITQDNFFNAAMTENIAPGRSDYGVWELSEKVRQVKVKLKAVEFYDAPPWRDEDIELWVEKEGGRYQVNGVEAAPAPVKKKAPAKRSK